MQVSALRFNKKI